MKKILQSVFIMVTVLMILTPAFTMNVRKNQVSSMDNRQLNEFPEFAAGGGFRASMENYLSDRIGFREYMITWYQTFCDRVFHVLEHPLYSYGKDGYVMAVSWDLTTYQHRDTSEDYVNNLAAYVKNISDFCKEQGSEFLFYLCPNKETIYPEYCDESFHVKNQPNRSEQIIKKLESENLPYIYPKTSFVQLKETEQLYNKKHDAGHWNAKGCFYGQKEAIAYLNKIFPEMGELEESEFSVSTQNIEYLINSRFRINEQVPVYELKETSAMEDVAIFENLTLADPDMYHYHYKSEDSSDAKKPKILIYGDSYFGESAKYYLNHCSELLLLHSHNMKFADYCISTYQPDIVIFEAVERVLQTSGFIDDSRVSKRFYSLNGYEQLNYKKEELQLDEEIIIFDKGSKSSGYVTFEGNVRDAVKGSETPAVMTAAVVNGKEYMSVFDEKTQDFQFLFQKSDLQEAKDIVFYRILRTEDSP